MKNYSLLICFCLLGKIGLAQDVTTQITHVQGGQLGAIALTMLGGYAPYDFSWTGPNNFRAVTEDISGLESGQYCVDVSDAHCGTLQLCVIVEDCRPIIVRFRQSAPCQGQNNGSITAVTYSAARQPLRYQWSNGQTTQTAANLAAGIYSVTVTDAVGCTDTRSEMLLPQTILVDGSVQNACTGGRTTGGVQLQANIIPTSWSSMMRFRWSNGSTEQNLTGVGAGTYTVTVSGGNNCTQTASFNVRNLFEENVWVQLGDKENSSYCDSRTMACDGRINLAVVRADRPLNFNWSGPNGTQTGQSITDLCAGTYRVTASDNNGCQMTLPPIALCCCENDFETTGTASNPLACSPRVFTSPTVTLLPQSPDYSNQNTGSIQLNITGNPNYIGGYTIRWEGPGVTGSSARTLTGLGVGRYCVTVKDGCYTVEQCVTLVACKEQTIRITGVTIPSCDGASNLCKTGAIQNVTVTGGSAPYKYEWSNGSRTQNLSNLAGGLYCVTVTTVDGCQQTKWFTIDKVALQERTNRSDCSWIDKYCPINNAVIIEQDHFVGSSVVDNWDLCRVERRCMDGTAQTITTGRTRFEAFKLKYEAGRLLCVHETTCTMMNGDSRVTRTDEARTTFRVQPLGGASLPCLPNYNRVDYFCGANLLRYDCTLFVRRDTSDRNPIESASFMPETFAIPTKIRATETILKQLPKDSIQIGQDSIPVLRMVPVAEIGMEMLENLQKNHYTLETVYPNPFQDKISIHLNVWDATEIQIHLVDILGTIHLEQKQALFKGFNQIELNLPALSAGLYNLEIVSKEGPKKTVHKMVRL